MCGNSVCCTFFNAEKFTKKEIADMNVTEEMYLTLFNGITDAREKLTEAMKLLDDIQTKSEELYIAKEE